MAEKKKKKTILMIVTALVLAGAGVYAYINMDKLEGMIQQSGGGDTRDYLALAQQAQHGGDFDKALDYYQAFLDVHADPPADTDPGVSTAYAGMGNIYFKRFKYGKAIEYLEKALDHSTRYAGKHSRQAADQWYALARVYDKQGEVKQALDHYRTSRDIQTRLGTDTERVDQVIDELENYLVNANLQSRSAS